MRLVRSFVLVALVSTLLPGSALAGDMKPLTRNYDTLTDDELDARADFIAERLDAGKTWASRWQWGWTTAYASGVVIGATRAGFTDDGDNRADYLTTAIKGVIGTTRLLLRPHPGRVGSGELNFMKKATRRDKIARLQRAEEMLQAVAKKAEERKNWKAHAGNLALNLAGAGATWALGNSDDAWENLLVGVTVGEIHIWSAPWRGPKDVEDYQTQFGMKSSSRFDWKVVPTLGGASFQMTW